jgi:hypothetical protein
MNAEANVQNETWQSVCSCLNPKHEPDLIQEDTPCYQGMCHQRNCT